MSRLNLLVKGVTGFWSSNQTYSRTSLPFFTYLFFVFFLPTQLGKHFWFDESQVLGIRLDYLSPTLYVTDILLFVTGVLLLFGTKHVSFLARRVPPRLLIVSFVFVCVPIVVSLFTVSRPLLVWYGLFKILEMGLVVWCTALFLRVPTKRMRISLVFSVSMLFQSILGLSQFVMQSSVNGLLYVLGERSFTILTPGIATAEIGGQLLLRPYGTLPHPNVLAGYLLVGSVFLLSAYRLSSSQAVRFWIRIVWLFSGLTLLLSLSRTGIVLALFVLLILVFHTRLITRLRNISRIVIVGSVGIGILIFPLLFERFQTLRFDSESVTQRLSLLESGLRMFSDNVFIGVGMSHFLVRLPEYMEISSSVFFLQPIHNIYLLVFVETGLLGGIGFVLFFLFLFMRLQKMRGFEKVIGSLLLGVILLVGMVDHYVLTLQQGQFLFAFVVGYIVSIGSSSVKEQ